MVRRLAAWAGIGYVDVACSMISLFRYSSAVSTSSGASWAPRTPTYGGNDRTHYVRIPDGNRIELRGGDGSANPYLAAACALAAGLDGIKRELDPGDFGTGPSGALPITLLAAIEAFEADSVLTATLDAAGPGVAAYYVTVKRQEFYSWHGAVSPWELENYLAKY